MLSRVVSELSQLIVQIFDTLRFQVTLWGVYGQRTMFILGLLESASGLPISVN